MWVSYEWVGKEFCLGGGMRSTECPQVDKLTHCFTTGPVYFQSDSRQVWHDEVEIYYNLQVETWKLAGLWCKSSGPFLWWMIHARVTLLSLYRTEVPKLKYWIFVISSIIKLNSSELNVLSEQSGRTLNSSLLCCDFTLEDSSAQCSEATPSAFALWVANEHANVTVFTAGSSSWHFTLDLLCPFLIAPYKCKIVTAAISRIVCWHGWLNDCPRVLV